MCTCMSIGSYYLHLYLPSEAEQRGWWGSGKIQHYPHTCSECLSLLDTGGNTHTYVFYMCSCSYGWCINLWVYIGACYCTYDGGSIGGGVCGWARGAGVWWCFRQDWALETQHMDKVITEYNNKIGINMLNSWWWWWKCVHGNTHYLKMRQLALMRVDLGFVENQQWTESITMESSGNSNKQLCCCCSLVLKCKCVSVGACLCCSHWKHLGKSSKFTQTSCWAHLTGTEESALLGFIFGVWGGSGRLSHMFLTRLENWF